ncbi:MAG: amidohydrolase family protein [Trueperaceae bacterium]
MAITDGRISGIYRHDELPDSPEKQDYSGCLIFPGIIDAHVHAYSSSSDQEGVYRLTRAAAAGGVSTVIDMPYDRPRATTTTELLRAKIDVVEREAVVDVALFGTTTKYDGWKQIVPLAQAGVCAFKFSTYETDPDRFPEIPDFELIKIFRELQKVGLVATFHAESGTIIDPLIEELRPLGEEHPEAHCWSRPPISESIAVLKLLELARAYPIKLHIAHLTAPQGYEAVEWYRAQGVDVTAETCIQYLLLTEEALREKGAYAKCNPPVRDEAIQSELWRRLFAGGIDFVTSDHAPWSADFKDKPNIFDNASGLPGVEHLLPLTYSSAVVDRALELPALAELLSAGPAKRYGLYPRKGALLVGADADVTVLDPSQRWTLDAGKGQSVARWSPYDGMKLTGKVVKTLVRGREAFDGNEVTAAEGSGAFVTPRHS